MSAAQHLGHGNSHGFISLIAIPAARRAGLEEGSHKSTFAHWLRTHSATKCVLLRALNRARRRATVGSIAVRHTPSSAAISLHVAPSLKRASMRFSLSSDAQRGSRPQVLLSREANCASSASLGFCCSALRAAGALLLTICLSSSRYKVPWTLPPCARYARHRQWARAPFSTRGPRR